MSYVEIVSVLTGSHSEDQMGIRIAKQSCSRLVLWVRTSSPSLSQMGTVNFASYTARIEFLQDLRNINPFTMQILLLFLVNQSKLGNIQGSP